MPRLKKSAYWIQLGMKLGCTVSHILASVKSDLLLHNYYQRPINFDQSFYIQIDFSSLESSFLKHVRSAPLLSVIKSYQVSWPSLGVGGMSCPGESHNSTGDMLARSLWLQWDFKRKVPVALSPQRHWDFKILSQTGPSSSRMQDYHGGGKATVRNCIESFFCIVSYDETWIVS